MLIFVGDSGGGRFWGCGGGVGQQLPGPGGRGDMTAQEGTRTETIFESILSPLSKKNYQMVWVGSCMGQGAASVGV